MKTKYLKIFILISILTLANRGLCAVDYNNFAPAPFASRTGIGAGIEAKRVIQAKKAETTEKTNAQKTQAQTTTQTTTITSKSALTYADLSLKQISKDIIDDVDFESPEILADLSTLYNSAVQNSETIKYAIYKLSNPNGDKPNEGAIKKLLKPIASFSTIAGTALSSNPYVASSALIGGGLLNAFSKDDKEINYKFTNVNDADMVILVKKIDELQKNLLNSYLNYRNKKEILSLSMKNLENRRKIYNAMQNDKKNTSREQLIIADTYYRNAQTTVKKAQAEYNLSRVILENLAGKEALSQIEKNKN